MSTARTGNGARHTTKPRTTTATTATTARKRTRSVADISISTEERQSMIREAAYYRAERRGFHPGDEMADWLAAESEVDSLITVSRSR